MRYTEPTKQVKQHIADLFGMTYKDEYSWREDSIDIETKDDGYYLTVKNMYEYVSFQKPYTTLTGMMKIAELLGATEGDEIGRDAQGGCETCDYGSSYEVEWKFW